MSIVPFPLQNPDNSKKEVFNLNDWNFQSGYVRFSDIIGVYAKLTSVNFFQSLNIFTDITFSNSLNNIRPTVFQLVNYLPNIISAITGISFDTVSNTTIVDSHLLCQQDGLMQTNLVVGGTIIVGSVLQSDIITCRSQTSKQVITTSLCLGGNTFRQTIAYLHVNNMFTFLVCGTIPIANLNIDVTSLSISLLSGFRVDAVDINNTILFSLSNQSSFVLYNQTISVNSDMSAFNCYDCRNILLV